MNISTEEKILIAAKKIFTRKGYAAARMQEIADTAEINKGLLHYYFKSKEKLFRAVFEEAFAKLTREINYIFESDLSLFEKIEGFVNKYIDQMIDNPYLPAFVINELNQNQEAFIKDILGRKEKPNPFKLLTTIQTEVNKGTIRPINPVQLVLNMISMCVFPFVAKPLLQGVVNIDDETYMQMMDMRKKEIVEFIINAIEKK
jgi:AcrR family transcriptional regulator